MVLDLDVSDMLRICALLVRDQGVSLLGEWWTGLDLKVSADQNEVILFGELGERKFTVLPQI